MQDLPFIQFQGMVLMEPMNFITNLFLAFACFIFVLRLKKSASGNIHSRLYQSFFLGIALSALGGGLTHLFAHYISGMELRAASWMFLGLSVACIQMVTVLSHAPKRFIPYWALFISLQFLVYLAFLWTFMNFQVAMINSIIGLLFFVAPVEFTHYFKVKNRDALLIASGIIVTLSAAIVHVMELSIHRWFNHNDLGHVVTAFCLVLIFKGAYNRVSSPGLQNA